MAGAFFMHKLGLTRLPLIRARPLSEDKPHLHKRWRYLNDAMGPCRDWHGALSLKTCDQFRKWLLFRTN